MVHQVRRCGFVFLVVAACSQERGTGGVVDRSRLEKAAGEGASWLTIGRTYDEQRFSPLQGISAASVSKLGLAWSAQFDTDRGQEATPLVADGVLYTSTSWSKVHAFDAKTGQRLWSWDPKVDGARGFTACCDVVNRGVALWNGKVYVGALDGRLVALDAKTGAERWSVVTVDQSKPYTITGAPRVVKGKVLIGNGGADYGVRGYLSAYDAETGALAWRFYTTPNAEGKPDGAASDSILATAAAPTWFDGLWKHSGGGGTVWDAMAYDPELDLLYFGVGNGSPWNHRLRSGGKGDNLFLSSIVAVRPDNGAYVWHYQTTPGESWDYTATQPIMLADLTIGGQPRKVLMQAPKNGFFYVLDRATGALLSAKNYVQVNWASGVGSDGRPIENPGVRYEKALALVSPSPYGAHSWHPMSFHPGEGLVYIPAIEAGFPYVAPAAFAYRDGHWNSGVSLDPLTLPDDTTQRAAIKATFHGKLIAWDPVKQEARWTVDHPGFWNAGVLATAGGLVFQGDAEGRLAAYSAKDGKEVWHFDAGNGIIAAPSSYEVDGEQYLAVMVGYGGVGPLISGWMLPNRPRQPGRLLVFKLGGTAALPAYAAPAVAPVSLDGATSTGNAAAGLPLFNANCLSCHGPNASGHLLPDLTHSAKVASAEEFTKVVFQGTRSGQGMASFAKFLSAAQVEDVRAYILSEAHKARASGAGAGQ